MSKKIILVLSILGIAVSIYLSWTYLSGSHIACTNHGCEAVRSSSYSRLFAIPLPIFGVLFYLAVGFLALISQMAEKNFTIGIKRLIIIVSTLGFLYSVYLTSVEAFVIKAYCEWCLVSAGISTLIFIIVLRSAFYEKTT